MAIKIKKEKEGKGFEWIEVHSVHEINVVKVYLSISLKEIQNMLIQIWWL